MELTTVEQGSAAWLAARSRRITASDFGAACGHNKYKSAKQLMKDKIWPQPPDPNDKKSAMRWGTLHEDLACDLYECYHREVLRTPGFRVRHAGLLVCAAPDDVVGLKCSYM